MPNQKKFLISFLGDSITDANWIRHNYVSLVGEYLGVDVQNCGVSGSTVGVSNRKTEWSNFIAELPKIDKQADLVFVLGGTNDFGTCPNQAIELGNIASKDTHTYYGALQYIADYLLTFLTKDRIILGTPMRRDEKKLGFYSTDRNEFGSTFIDYVNAVKDVANKYSFKEIDLYHDFKEYNPANPHFYDVSDDGLHPNDLGHQVMAKYLAEIFKPLVLELGKK